MYTRLYEEDAGVLMFEWILLIILVVVGSAVLFCAVRECVAAELQCVSEAIARLDQTYSVHPPIQITICKTWIDGSGNKTVICFPPAEERCGSVGYTYTDSQNCCPCATETKYTPHLTAEDVDLRAYKNI